MEKARIRELGDELFTALRSRSTVPPLTVREPDIGIEDAYRISRRLLERRQAEDERVVGKKIGVTSRAVQEMLGVHQPDFGFLTDAMEVPNGSKVRIADSLIQPRAEGEIAFELKADLVGPGITAEQVLAATAWVRACFEIVDSRIADWKIAIQDTVADNASCGIYLLGDERIDPRTLDLAEAEIRLSKNGELISTGLGSAVQGNPCTAVAWLANTLGEFGIPLRAGEVVLSGSVVPLEPALPGDRFELEWVGQGSAAISFC